MNDIPFKQGFQAAIDGLPEDANPYKLNEGWHFLWLAGWSDYEPSIRKVTCPKCGFNFLVGEENLIISGCDSGGIYAIKIVCKKCKHKEVII